VVHVGFNKNMQFLVNPKKKDLELQSLFKASFTASEGAEEGDRISNLVARLLSETASNDIQVVAAEVDGRLWAAGIFTRLLFDQDERVVFILSPLAVATEHQRKGLGQALLRYSFSVLRNAKVDLVLTYGDPSFYSKVGFQPVSEKSAAPPFALTYPHGWLGQSLTSKPWSTLTGSSSCVSALKDPIYW
jgi:putative acetyltransferase